MAQGGNDLTNCPVCYEEYKEKGYFVPRVLPCLHTLCESCCEKLLKGNVLRCPLDRLIHTLPGGVKSLPLNKRIVTDLKKARHARQEEKRGKGHFEHVVADLSELSVSKEKPTDEASKSSVASFKYEGGNGKEKETMKKKHGLVVKLPRVLWSKSGPNEAARGKSLQFRCKVTQSITCDYSHLDYISSLNVNTVIVCGRRHRHYKLTKYNTQHGAELSSATLQAPPCGVTDVMLAGRLCVALSYPFRKTIDFHDTRNLNTVVLSYSVAPHEPAEMCALPQGALLYVDLCINPCELRWLDCSTSPPKRVVPRNKIYFQEDDIFDICYARLKDKPYLISTHYSGKLLAYNTSTNQVEWSLEGKPPGIKDDVIMRGVTTDGDGNLFVCDVSRGCIHMFPAGGRFIETVLREGEQGLGQLEHVRWCKGLVSGLVVSHRKNGKWVISIVIMEREQMHQKSLPHIK